MRLPEAISSDTPTPGLCPAVQRLHTLAWRPGAVMHPGWWAYLGLAAWQDDYARHPGCQRALDALIVQRRGFPDAALPAALSDEQKRLLAMEGRLPLLVVALGLVAARLPELLLLGSYRRQLVPILGEAGCDQLAALVPEPNGQGAGPPGEPLGAWLAELGRNWLDRTLPGSLLWQALSVTLPPPQPSLCAPSVTAPAGLALPVLFRLERLL